MPSLEKYVLMSAVLYPPPNSMIPIVWPAPDRAGREVIHLRDRPPEKDRLTQAAACAIRKCGLATGRLSSPSTAVTTSCKFAGIVIGPVRPRYAPVGVS